LQHAFEVAHLIGTVEEGGGLFVQDDLGDPFGADVRRLHHPIGPGVQQHPFGAGRFTACNDLYLRMHVASSERDEHVRGVVRQHGCDYSCPRHTSRL
jgi:hypothetical protein